MSIASSAPSGYFYLAITGNVPSPDALVAVNPYAWWLQSVMVYTPAPSPPTPPVCPTPAITSVTPDVWFAGKSYNVNIKGTGFTNTASCPAPQVNIDDASGNTISYSSASVVNATKIVATAVAPPANTPAETVCVTVAQGSSGVPMAVRSSASAAASATPAPGTAGSSCYDPYYYLDGITAQIENLPTITLERIDLMEVKATGTPNVTGTSDTSAFRAVSR
jgi:hypothetical protein